MQHRSASAEQRKTKNINNGGAGVRMAGDGSCREKRFLGEQMALNSGLPLRRNIRLWKEVGKSLRSKLCKGRKPLLALSALSCSLVCRAGTLGFFPSATTREEFS